MKFDIIIDNLLKEELSREDRIKALKSLRPDRTFTVDVFTDGLERNYQVMGRTLYDALTKLPEHAFYELFKNVSNPDKFKESEEDLLEYINSRIDGYTNSYYVYIFEDGRLLCTSDDQYLEQY